MASQPLNELAADLLVAWARLQPEGTTERDMAFEIADAWRGMTEEDFLLAAAGL